MTIASNLGLATTMIGSLPHHNIDAALGFSFQMDVPFLPQIPIRNPWEYMIAQALEGLPGLQAEADGSVLLDTDVWSGRSHTLNQRLLTAFSTMAVRTDAFEGFEPSAPTSSGWQPFLWELQERGAKIAKVQIAGPLTAQWALKLSDGSALVKYPELTSQIYRLVLARALAMSRRLQSYGIQPVLYLDEPGLYGFDMADPRHALAHQELKLLVQALRKENVVVGLHCCSNTDWSAVLALELNIVSIDTKLSLEHLLTRANELERFLASGGRLSLGVIATDPGASAQNEGALEPRVLFQALMNQFARTTWANNPALVRKALVNALYTPACGLALHSTAEAENVVNALVEFGRYAKATLLKQA